MKRIILPIFFISLSLLSFSQKRDTFNLLGPSQKKVKKDVAQELQSHPASKLDSVYYIKYGTSTNKCTGYCFHEAVVDSVHMMRSHKSLPEDKTHPAKTDSTEITSDQWNMLINSVEISSFFAIPEKIGNPDAAGAAFEWIEINYIGKLHKITYDNTGPDEYEGIKNLSKLLKRLTGF